MRKKVIAIGVVLLLAGGAFYVFGRGLWYPLLLQITGGPRTVADVVKRYGPAAHKRLGPHFTRAGVAYPPKQIALLVFKKDRQVAD